MIINWPRRVTPAPRRPTETVRELRAALGQLDPDAYVWLQVNGQGAVLKCAEVEIVDDHVYLNLSDRPVRRARHKRSA